MLVIVAELSGFPLSRGWHSLERERKRRRVNAVSGNSRIGGLSRLETICQGEIRALGRWKERIRVREVLCAMVVVFLFVALGCASAGAGPLPAEGWDMPIFMHARNWDMGTVWQGASGAYTDPHNDPALTRVGPTGGIGNEDT